MVSHLHYGRLGNFLYQTAAAIGYAHKYNLEYSVPSTTNQSFWNPLYLQHLVNPNWDASKQSVLLTETWNANQQYNEYPFQEEWRNDNIILNGYNQSYKYFDFCKDETIKAFGYPYEMDKDVCSIHVRRGDYLLYPTLHPICTASYYAEAMRTAIKLRGVKIFKVFSDDIPYCKDWFKNMSAMMEYSEGKTPEQDLVRMANCEHQICSNSTLALWGAELNQNPDKIVIVPDESNWFGHGNRLTVKDMFRPEWVRIKYKPVYEV